MYFQISASAVLGFFPCPSCGSEYRFYLIASDLHFHVDAVILNMEVQK